MSRPFHVTVAGRMAQSQGTEATDTIGTFASQQFPFIWSFASIDKDGQIWLSGDNRRCLKMWRSPQIEQHTFETPWECLLPVLMCANHLLSFLRATPLDWIFKIPGAGRVWLCAIVPLPGQCLLLVSHHWWVLLHMHTATIWAAFVLTRCSGKNVSTIIRSRFFVAAGVRARFLSRFFANQGLRFGIEELIWLTCKVPSLNRGMGKRSGCNAFQLSVHHISLGNKSYIIL